MPGAAASDWSSATTIDAVLERMDAIAAAHPAEDGVATFDRMYREVTRLVRDAELYNPSEAQIEKAREAYRKKNEPFVVRVAAEQMSLDTLEEMKSVFDQHQGDSDVVMVVDGEREHHLKLGPDYRVRHSPGLTTEIDQIFGEGTAARAA